MLTAPPAPSPATTRLGRVCPDRSRLTFDAVGRAVPAGQTVTKPASVASVAVRLRTTAPTPAPGSPARPASGRWVVSPATRLGPSYPIEAPVSRTRAGGDGTRVGGGGGAGGAGGVPGAVFGQPPSPIRARASSRRSWYRYRYCSAGRSTSAIQSPYWLGLSPNEASPAARCWARTAVA